MKLLSFLTVIFALLAASSAVGEDKPEAYAKQPSINAAIKQLTAAQAKATNNQAEALVHLQKASGSLQNSIKDKGSFRATAIRMTNQAIKHLEKGDSATALHEIDEALENAHRAGKAGSN